MSRHRNIRNINIEEELEEDDDVDYYGKSMDEDDEPLTPGTSKFMYSRPNYTSQHSNSSRKLDDYILEEEPIEDGANVHSDEMFPMDDVVLKPAKKEKKPPVAPNSSKKTAFTIGSSDPKKPPSSGLPPSVEHLRISEGKHPTRANSKSPARAGTTLTPNTSFQRLSPLDIALASNSTVKVRTRPEDSKQSINLVIVGHVDAGKSTLMGHLLHLLGNVDDKTMHRHKQEATRAGKSSFAFAWILDEGEEERNRGVTMDIARASFESQKRTFNILDAPGHKDFIPNMITGASQADAALLVINSTRGEFETGFDQGGQTREHALLLRSLGVSKIIAAVNKLDTIDWSQDRFVEVKEALTNFLRKQAGFDNIDFIPVSGLLGANLSEKPADDHPLRKWYNGPTLLEALDNLPMPSQVLDGLPLRIVLNDVLRYTPNSITVSAKVETGFVEAGDKLFIMPDANAVTVKVVSMDGTMSPIAAVAQKGPQSNKAYFAGDQVVMTLTGSFEPDSIYPGHILCRGGVNELLVPTQHFSAKIVVFDIRMPILKGTRAELFSHSLRVPCVVTRLESVVNKATKEVIKRNPRVLTKNTSAVVEIKTDLPINLESYSKCKILSRFTLRSNNETIAAGVMDRSL